MKQRYLQALEEVAAHGYTRDAVEMAALKFGLGCKERKKLLNLCQSHSQAQPQ